MPHSLRAKLSGLHYKGILEDKDYKRLCHALDLEKAEQEHKSGKWTLMYEPKNIAVCSECGKCAYMYQDKTSAFCPHCGADMREEQTE